MSDPIDNVKVLSFVAEVTCCDCDYSEEISIGIPTGGDEFVDTALACAGMDEQGRCESCVRQAAAEEAADRAMRDRKARMEDAL